MIVILSALFFHTILNFREISHHFVEGFLSDCADSAVRLRSHRCSPAKAIDESDLTKDVSGLNLSHIYLFPQN